MKTIKILSIFAIFLAFTSCSDDDDGPIILPIESDAVINLYAPQVGGQGSGQDPSGAFTKFNFATGTTTTGDDWDVAFRGTSILINGGASMGTTDEPARTGNGAAYIKTGTTLGGVTQVDTSLLVQDASTGLAISGWYTYTGPPNHLINADAGKVIVVKTHDGKYAKMEILSYYKDGDTSSDYRYYTFNYVYQPNEGETSF